MNMFKLTADHRIKLLQAGTFQLEEKDIQKQPIALLCQGDIIQVQKLRLIKERVQVVT